MRPPRVSEKQFMGQVVQLATLLGWRCFHVYDSRRCVPGFPDLVLVRRGVIVFAELKVGRNKTTPEQDAWLAALEPAARVYVWRPEDWPAIEEVLR